MPVHSRVEGLAEEGFKRINLEYFFGDSGEGT
jgi:hypothetical protein